MRFRVPMVSAVAFVLCAVAVASPSPARAGTDTYLPDSAVLARVDSRILRVYDFRDRYFSSDADTRPRADSLGRVEFLHTLANKEVMSLEAIAAGTALEPNDELLLHRYENQLLALRIYQRRVQQPVVITAKDLHALYALESFELKLRYLLFPDETTARFVHSQLVHGKITWRDAAHRYSVGPDSLADHDLGWQSRVDLTGEPTTEIFSLQPPGISDVLKDADGFKIWQCLDRRPVQMPVFSAIRRLLLNELSATRSAPLEAAFFNEMRATVKPAYDTTNVVWLADRFRAANANLGNATGMDLRSRVPQVTVADTSRVLATARGVRYTAGRIIEAYRDIPPIRRHRIVTTSALFDMLERMVLEPAVVEYARAQNLQNAPDVVAEMQKKREGMLVGHFYDDSVQARIEVTSEDRHKYYNAHKAEFVSRERVRYAVIPRLTEAGADSVVARLKAGETPLAILAADSLNDWNGTKPGFIKDLFEGEAHTFYNVLFQELHTGEATKVYLGGDNLWSVFYIVQHEMPRPMAYEQVVDIVDQTVENLAAERLLNGLIDRLRARHTIVEQPRLVMRIMLQDPTSDWNVPTGD